jgi:bacteriorhodopsin
MMLESSAYISLIIQLLVGVVDLWGISIDIPNDKNIFKDLLKLELGVQVVEFAFYLWMVLNITTVKNITPYRYLDWFITTPTMLLTLMIFLSKDKETYNGIVQFISDNKDDVIKVGLSNVLMLVFGLLGEYQYINNTLAVGLGFIPFVYYYKKIYDKNITEESTSQQKGFFWFFFIVWSVYGLAALLPYIPKNVLFNILDLFSKNLIGVILVYIIYKNKLN